MPKIFLPDGSQRTYAQPVTALEVAADIGPGLAKATLAADIDGKVVDATLPIERDARPVLLFVWDDDPIVRPPFHQLLENPQQVVRRDAEHRRAEASKPIERDDGAPGRELVREAVYQMHFGADGPD